MNAAKCSAQIAKNFIFQMLRKNYEIKIVAYILA